MKYLLIVLSILLGLALGALLFPQSANPTTPDGRLQVRAALQSAVILRTSKGRCAGVIVAARVVLTVAHCVDGVTSLAVKTYASQTFVVARLVRIRAGWDLATLETDVDLVGVPARLAPDVYPGDFVWVVGAPDGEEFFATHGTVGKTTRAAYPGRRFASEDHQIVMIDGLIYFGSSGGGAYNVFGQIVGVAARAIVYGDGRDTQYAGEYILWGNYVGLETVREFLR